MLHWNDIYVKSYVNQRLSEIQIEHEHQKRTVLPKRRSFWFRNKDNYSPKGDFSN